MKQPRKNAEFHQTEKKNRCSSKYGVGGDFGTFNEHFQYDDDDDDD